MDHITGDERPDDALRGSELSLRRSQALLQLASRLGRVGAWARPGAPT